HLINMMRHRRVQWAAMEFLLVSQKKNRTWVLLKQLLLLLMRMGAVAAVALLVAQPQLRNRLGGWFVGSKTHHVVLLDDSFSMSDSWGGTSAFEEGKERVLAIARQAEQQNTPQEFTLLRFSRAARTGRAMEPDLREAVGANFAKTVEDKLETLKVSELSVGPADALDSALQLIEDSPDQHLEIYVVSDFRANEWNEADDLRERLKEFNEQGVEPKLVACVDAARPNLAITSLKPLPGTRAAGVNLVMEVTVHNYGIDTAKNVTIQLKEDDKTRPTETIEELAAGKSQTRTFEVKFTTASQHRIEARLQADGVVADDARYTVVDFAPSVPVLLIEGDERAIGSKESDSYYVANAISPEPALTGIKPQIEPRQFLRTKPLAEFHAIYLMNVERLEETEIAALTEYTKAGGGVVFFTGDRTQAADYTKRLYRDGEGIFPVPLAGPVLLEEPISERTPDMEVSAHPIFGKFAGDRNPFITAVNVTRYMAVQRNWKPAADSTAKVIARLRNGAPLIVERSFGEGRVVAVLTTAGPAWNNWARANPSYIVTLQQLQAHLSLWKQGDPARQVGTPLVMQVPAANYVPEIGMVTPLEGTDGMFTAKGTVENDRLAMTLDNTEKSGIYEARLTTNEGQTESLEYAYNVVPTEGNLAVVNEQEMSDRLGDVVYEYHRAGELAVTGSDAGQKLSETILYLLVALLIGEQLLAYSASYHPPRRELAAA
ncbi:MAG: CARDB domain-containing protein, partial [Pirellulales bacterium]